MSARAGLYFHDRLLVSRAALPSLLGVAALGATGVGIAFARRWQRYRVRHKLLRGSGPAVSAAAAAPRVAEAAPAAEAAPPGSPAPLSPGPDTPGGRPAAAAAAAAEPEPTPTPTPAPTPAATTPASTPAPASTPGKYAMVRLDLDAAIAITAELADAMRHAIDAGDALGSQNPFEIFGVATATNIALEPVVRRYGMVEYVDVMRAVAEHAADVDFELARTRLQVQFDRAGFKEPRLEMGRLGRSQVVALLRIMRGAAHQVRDNYERVRARVQAAQPEGLDASVQLHLQVESLMEVMKPMTDAQAQLTERFGVGATDLHLAMAHFADDAEVAEMRADIEGCLAPFQGGG